MLLIPIDICDAEYTLAKEGFSRATMLPNPDASGRVLPTDPSIPRNAVVLSRTIVLRKLIWISSSHKGAACCECDWPRLRAIARANSRPDTDINFSCDNMICSSTPSSYFVVRKSIPGKIRPIDVTVVVPQAEPKREEFDFADWDAIKRSTGF